MNAKTLRLSATPPFRAWDLGPGVGNDPRSSTRQNEQIIRKHLRVPRALFGLSLLVTLCGKRIDILSRCRRSIGMIVPPRAKLSIQVRREPNRSERLRVALLA